jgi:hypothetical protein
VKYPLPIPEEVVAKRKVGRHRLNRKTDFIKILSSPPTCETFDNFVIQHLEVTNLIDKLFEIYGNIGSLDY